MWTLKILLLICFFAILFQDSKDRKVYWFLYPVIGLIAFAIQTQQNNFFISITNSLVNLLFIFMILSICYFYAKFKLKQHFTDEVFGLGDILFFIFITFSFASISFVILFIFSLFFSLLLHAFLKNNNSDKTVPLAGYMSLFFGTVYIISFFCNINFLFAY